MEQVNDTNFEQAVLKANKPVLVDFFADWCGPCRQMLPIADELSQEMTSQVKIVKLNVDEAENTAEKYEIQSIPTMILFKNGAKAAEHHGDCGKDELRSWIQSNL